MDEWFEIGERFINYTMEKNMQMSFKVFESSFAVKEKTSW